MSNSSKAKTTKNPPRRLGRGLAGLIPSAPRPAPSDAQSLDQPQENAGQPAASPNDTSAPSDSSTPESSTNTEAQPTPSRKGGLEAGIVELNAGALASTDAQASPSEHRNSPVMVGGHHQVDVPRGTHSPTNPPSSEGGSFQIIDIDSIKPNPHQPREHFDQQALEELASSIRSSGLIQPITVRKTGAALELVAGERRLKASRIAGLSRIPAIVRDVSDRASAEWALVENLQREDLNPIERANGLRRLIDEFSLTHQQAAAAVGLERASVSNLLRILDLDPTTTSLVARGSIGLGHAKVLLAVDDPKLRSELAQTVIARNWSVRRLEMEVRRLLAPASATSKPSPSSPNRTRTPHIDKLERSLSDHLGTRVHIAIGRREGQGRLLIDFHSLEHFDDLMERLGFAGPDE